MIVISCVTMTAACQRDPPDQLIGGTLARQLFDKNVEPLLETTCADCHSNPDDSHHAPDYLDTVPGDYYASLVSRKDFVSCNVDNSLLLLKGLEPEHPGGALTPPQHDRVLGWLQEEAIERFHGTCSNAPPDAAPGGDGAQTPPEPLTGLKALQQLGDCMTLDDWKAQGMPLVARQIATQGQQAAPCSSCHATGPGLNYMPDPDGPDADAKIADAFEKMRRVYSIFKLVRWTVHDEDGSFKDIVQSHRWRDKTDDLEHPSYELAQQYQDAIDAWFNATYERWKSGSCQ